MKKQNPLISSMINESNYLNDRLVQMNEIYEIQEKAYYDSLNTGDAIKIENAKQLLDGTASNLDTVRNEAASVKMNLENEYAQEAKAAATAKENSTIIKELQSNLDKVLINLDKVTSQAETNKKTTKSSPAIPIIIGVGALAALSIYIFID